MALQKKIANIPFSKGIQTKKTDVTLEPGELEVLENAIFNKHGEIEKRKGYTETQFEYPAGAGTHFFEGSFQYKGAYYGLEASGHTWRINPASPSTKSRLQSKWSPLSTEVFPLSPHDFSGSSTYNFVYFSSPEIAISTDDSLICIASAVLVREGSSSTGGIGYSVNLIDASNMSILKTTFGLSGSTFAKTTFYGRIKPVAISATQFAVYYEYNKEGADGGAADELNRTIFGPDNDGAIASSSDSLVALVSDNYLEHKDQCSFDVVESFTANCAYVGYYRHDSTYSVRIVKDTSITDNVASPSLTGTLDTSTGLGATAPPDTLLTYAHLAMGKSSIEADKIYIGFITPGVPHTIRVHNFTEGGSLSSAITKTSTDTEASFKLLYFVDNKEDPTVTSSIETVDLVYNSYGTGASDGEVTYRIPIKTPSSLAFHDDPQEINKGFAGSGAFQFTFGKNNHKTTIFPNLENREVYPRGIETLNYFDQDGNLVGTSLTANIGSTFNGHPGRAVRASDGGSAYGVMSTLGPPQSINDAAGFQFVTVPTIVKYSFDAVPTYGVRRAEIGKNIYWTAGNALFRDSFDLYQDIVGKPKPYIKTLTASDGGIAGGLDSSKTYKYKVVFEQEDSQGNLYQSEPSDSKSVATGSSDDTVTIVVNSASQKIAGGKYRILVYRTEGDGNLYYAAGNIRGQHSTFTQTLVDQAEDDDVLSSAALYTDSGEVANTRCPACFYVAAHRNRLFIISEDYRIFFSKEYRNGHGTNFNDTFFVPLDGILDDKPTALGSSGETLYIFRENSIWALDGDGPSRTGSGSYYTPRIVSNSMGALRGSPTLYSDIGLFFQNAKGIHAITGSGIKYIGAPVESTLGSSRVLDMIQDQATSTIRFLLNTSVLVYNYEFDQWSHFTFSTLGSDRFVGMGNNDGEIMLVTDSNKFWKESGYKLDTTYLVTKLKTGWISLNGIQGFARAYRFSLLGKSKDKHVLTVKVYYDYDDSAAIDTYTFTTDSATDALLQFRAHLSKQKCEAIKFEIYDADNSSATGDGFVIENIALEVGSKRGIFRTSETNTIGSA